jgi:glycosyltransferase involved in cell wall biosynthesis
VFSLIVPVYRNAENIDDLLGACRALNGELKGDLECIFVVDGSPDRSFELLAKGLSVKPFRSQLILLSRNFGSFAAIRCGLKEARGHFFGVMAADLQEPPELILEFNRFLREDRCDVVVGYREHRQDPLIPRVLALGFWRVYRGWVQPEMPEGGIDVFGCNQKFREKLLTFEELNSTLVGLLVWMGFRRESIAYRRRARLKGRSAWTLRKKARYLFDSIYAFSDLPFQILTVFGVLALVMSVGFGITVAYLRLTAGITIPGYAPTVILISFFGALQCLSFGVLGGYVFRAFENTKRRPPYLVQSHQSYEP